MGKEYSKEDKDKLHKKAVDFGMRLSQLRSKAGVSARKMSSELGYNHSYINSIENARSFPKIDGLFEICDYLGVTPCEFFRYNEEAGESGDRALLHEQTALLTEAQVKTVLSVVSEMLS